MRHFRGSDNMFRIPEPTQVHTCKIALPVYLALKEKNPVHHLFSPSEMRAGIQKIKMQFFLCVGRETPMQSLAYGLTIQVPSLNQWYNNERLRET